MKVYHKTKKCYKMELIERIQKYLFARALKKDTYIVGQARKAFSWSDMKNINILFDATNPTEREVVLQYADRLRQQGKVVRILAFINDKLEHSELPFSHFTLKDLTWTSTIKQGTARVEEFLTQQPDLLISLFSGESQAISYLTMRATATYKIAPFGGDEALHTDLMFKSNGNNVMKSLINQIEQFTAKISQKKHELTV